MSQYYYNPFGNSSVNEERERLFLRKQQEQKEKKEIRAISFWMGSAIIAYILMQTLAVSVMSAFGWYDLYNESSVFQSAFTIIGISFMSVVVPFGIMALINKKRYAYPIIPSKPVKASKGFAWVCFGMMCSSVANMAVSYVTTFLESLFDIEFIRGSSLEPDSAFACVMLVFSTAVAPAICEELAMRCCSLQLLRKYGKGFAVASVSIVFGLLHGNVVQFIFAFIVGLVLAYITVQTDSVVPAVLVHGLSNGISVTNSILNYASGEKAAQYTVVALYLFWIISGALCSAYLLFKGGFKRTSDKKRSVLTTGQKFVSFLFPWMIVPFVVLIYLTAKSIV